MNLSHDTSVTSEVKLRQFGLPQEYKKQRIKESFSLEEMLEHLQPNQLEHFEDLLAQSARGIHLMFDNELIADILKKPLKEDSYFTTENMTRAEDLLTAFLEKENVNKREEYLESLDLEDQELLVRTYFHLVESTVQQISEFKH